jgi:hypothetical protein
MADSRVCFGVYSVDKVGSQSSMLFPAEISRMRDAWNRFLTRKKEKQATLMRVCFSLNTFSTEYTPKRTLLN